MSVDCEGATEEREKNFSGAMRNKEGSGSGSRSSSAFKLDV